MSVTSKEILRRVEDWIQSFPPELVAITEKHGHDTEYGPATEFHFLPAKQEACSLEVLVLDTGACGFALESWSRLATRLKVGFSHLGTSAKDFAALYLEPTALAGDLVIQVCEAVAAGAIYLEVGCMFGRITTSRGFVETLSGPFRMNGLGGPVFFNRILRTIGWGDVQIVRFEPWVPAT